MLKEITFYADFVKKRWCDKKKRNRTFAHFFLEHKRRKKQSLRISLWARSVDGISSTVCI